MAKNKQLRARVEDELYERVQLKTNKMSDFVRDAVIEKLEKEEYGDQSTVAVEIKQLELLLESRQTIINQYQDLIEKEQKECDRLVAQITAKQKIRDKKVEREDKIKNNPAAKKIFEEAVMFLLRKKYLQLDGNVENVLSNKAKKLEYSNVQDFKEDLKKYVDAEWHIGRKFDIQGDLKDFIDQDYNYVINRL